MKKLNILGVHPSYHYSLLVQHPRGLGQILRVELTE
jgi:hypothetical protein